MNKKILLILIGLPRSGKSSWAKEQRNMPMVNPDSIRLGLHGKRFESLAEPFVWATAMLMVRSLFLAGHDMVILDATNTTQKRRDFWKSDEWELKFKLFNTSKEVCIERAKKDGMEDLIPVIERMDKEFESVIQD